MNLFICKLINSNPKIKKTNKIIHFQIDSPDNWDQTFKFNCHIVKLAHY